MQVGRSQQQQRLTVLRLGLMHLFELLQGLDDAGRLVVCQGQVEADGRVGRLRIERQAIFPDGLVEAALVRQRRSQIGTYAADFGVGLQESLITNDRSGVVARLVHLDHLLQDGKIGIGLRASGGQERQTNYYNAKHATTIMQAAEEDWKM